MRGPPATPSPSTDGSTISATGCCRTSASRDFRAPGEEPRLAAAELRRQGDADAEDRRAAPDDRADDRDHADRAEDQHADDHHRQVAAQPAAAGELIARARAGDEHADG